MEVVSDKLFSLWNARQWAESRNPIIQSQIFMFNCWYVVLKCVIAGFLWIPKGSLMPLGVQNNSINTGCKSSNIASVFGNFFFFNYEEFSPPPIYVFHTISASNFPFFNLENVILDVASCTFWRYISVSSWIRMNLKIHLAWHTCILTIVLIAEP